MSLSDLFLDAPAFWALGFGLCAFVLVPSVFAMVGRVMRRGRR